MENSIVEKEQNIATNLEMDYAEDDAKEILTLWMLRIIVKLGASDEFYDKNYYIRRDDIAHFLGLGEYVQSKNGFDKSTIGKRLKDLHAEAEKRSRYTQIPRLLQKNIEKLQKLIGLNEIECAILVFKVLLMSNRMLDNTADLIGYFSSREIFNALSKILCMPVADVIKALAPNGKLARSGLLTVRVGGEYMMNNKIDLLSEKFADMLINSDEDVLEFIKGSVCRTSDTSLMLDDYEHISTELSILKPYLLSVVDSRSVGSNVLIYGVPGTGKTELVKALAKNLGFDLYEVSYADEDENPIDGDKRLNALKACQSFFSKGKILLMFDEAEDVFCGNTINALLGMSQQNYKAWINRVLEENTLPTIWLTNSVDSMDNATIRRFDMVFELGIPPKKQRKAIANKLFEGLSEQTMQKIVQNDRIAPALLSRSANVLSKIKNNANDSSLIIETLLDGTLKAQGHKQLQKYSESSLPKHYNPAFVNTETNLSKLTEGLKETGEGRLCLYGPPGTGKSAFGKWIANTLDKPFLLKKGSDLLSMWAGEAEKNIARAFEEAREEGAVLVFDEVDGFLQDRRGANSSWEVTQVNEMLVQMENFDGIFIATTNLMDGLDQAAIRRFDLKLEFGYLIAEQAEKLLVAECGALNIEADLKAIEEIRHLNNLTPGDFAAISRQSRFSPIKTIEDFIKRLKHECGLKNDGSNKKMGFALFS